MGNFYYPQTQSQQAATNYANAHQPMQMNPDGTIMPAPPPPAAPPPPMVPVGNGSGGGGNPTIPTSLSSGPVGGQTAPITWAQQAELFQNPNADLEQGQISGMPLNSVANQISPSALSGLTTLNSGNIGKLTGQQFNQIGQLQAMANGQGPSLAALQARTQGEQNAANAAGLIASQRGASNPALGLRSALGAESAANQQAVQAGVAGRTAEEMQAQQALTGALGQAQGQQMGYAAQQQNTQLQGLIANLQAKQQTQGLNVNEYNAMVQAEQGLTNTDMTAAENYAQLVTGENTQLQGINADISINNNNNLMGLGGSVLQGAGAGIGYGVTASDRKLKFDVKKAERSVKAFMSNIKLPQPKFALMGA